MVEQGADMGGVPRREPGLGMHVPTIVLMFALIGPLVGTVVLAVLLAFVSAWDFWVHGLPIRILEMLGIIFAGPATGASYIAGGVPAAVAGLIVGIKIAYFGGASWRFVLGAGVLVGIALEVFVAIFIAPYEHGLLAMTCVVTTLSSLACWRMVTSWLKVPG
jgi:hypothetical protein